MPDRSAHGTGSVDALVPDLVRRLLATGEVVEARYVARGAEAYATGTRLIVLRAHEPTTFHFEDVAGVTESRRVAPWLILAGAALIALGATNRFFPVAGALLVLLGMFRGTRRLEILISGRSEPVVLEGAREVISPLAERLTQKGARRLDSRV